MGARGRSLVLLLVSAIVMLTSIAPGCGGDSGEPESLKRPAFVKEANEICVDAEEERTQYSEDLAEGDESEDEQAATEVLVSPVETMTEELSELGPPKGDEQQVEAIIAAFEGGVDSLDGKALGPESLSAFAKANEMAVEYGLTDCTI